MAVTAIFAEESVEVGVMNRCTVRAEGEGPIGTLFGEVLINCIAI